MRKVVLLLCVFSLTAVVGCATKIQEVYWEAGSSVALDAEKKGDAKTAETELVIALNRAQKNLTDKEIANSLFRLGSFYRRQGRVSDAIHYLSESLQKQETISGPASEATGRILAELAVAYLIENNKFDGRPIASRLKPIAYYFKNDEKEFVDQVLKLYEIDRSKYENDVSRLKPLADSGNREAQYQLASVYFDGPNAKELFPKIFELFEKSAKQGLPVAQHFMGVLYDKGRGGVRVDDAKARAWYRMAAENNNPIGQFNYAIFLLEGRGGEKNETEAISWLKKSSEKGHPSATKVLRQIAREQK
jgi:hypothetical protein